MTARSKRGCAVGVVVLLFASSMITILLGVAIWPGEAKLTAPFLCPDGQPDAFVVTDTYNVQPGETTTNFTLYCVGPDGDSTDVGFGIPMLLLMAGHTVILLLASIALSVLTAVRVKRRHPGLSMQDAAQVELADAARDAAGDDDAPPPPPPNNPIEGAIPPGPIIS